MNRILLLNIPLILLGCLPCSAGHAQEQSVSDAKKFHGFYLVERWTIKQEDLFPLNESERFFTYDQSKFFDDQEEPIKYLGLSKTEFIPFELAGEPAAIAQEDGRINVDVRFTQTTAKAIEEFSRKYLGRQVAFVVDDEVITLHKIRSVIKGGAVQISRCTDNGCEIILGKLKKEFSIKS